MGNTQFPPEHSGDGDNRGTQPQQTFSCYVHRSAIASADAGRKARAGEGSQSECIERKMGREYLVAK